MDGIKTKLFNAHFLGQELIHKEGTGPCCYPDCPRMGILRRQNTAYYDDSSNWAIYCDECQIFADEYWQGMWDEYNASRL